MNYMNLPIAPPTCQLQYVISMLQSSRSALFPGAQKTNHTSSMDWADAKFPQQIWQASRGVHLAN